MIDFKICKKLFLIFPFKKFIKIYSSNLSSVNLITRFKQRMDIISPYWDLLFGNEIEALTFAKMSNWNVNINIIFFFLFLLFPSYLTLINLLTNPSYIDRQQIYSK